LPPNTKVKKCHSIRKAVETVIAKIVISFDVQKYDNIETIPQLTKRVINLHAVVVVVLF
jgi:hypothetical protein